MIGDRKLTPEEKEKIHEWQAAEILRRRGVNGPPFVEPDAAKPGPKPGAIEYKCPKCGTPFANPKYRRCYACHPGSGRIRPPPRRVGLDEAFARPKGPAIVPASEAVMVAEPGPINHIADVGNMVEVGGDGKTATDVADHLGNATMMITPDPIAALRRVVDALDGLDADAVRWVLRSAARLPRAGTDAHGRE
jgi:DNA-directed RNA polymerase subunit RPC12/RpoP